MLCSWAVRPARASEAALSGERRGAGAGRGWMVRINVANLRGGRGAMRTVLGRRLGCERASPQALAGAPFASYSAPQDVWREGPRPVPPPLPESHPNPTPGGPAKVGTVQPNGSARRTGARKRGLTDQQALLEAVAKGDVEGALGVLRARDQRGEWSYLHPKDVCALIWECSKRGAVEEALEVLAMKRTPVSHDCFAAVTLPMTPEGWELGWRMLCIMRDKGIEPRPALLPAILQQVLKGGQEQEALAAAQLAPLQAAVRCPENRQPVYAYHRMLRLFTSLGRLEDTHAALAKLYEVAPKTVDLRTINGVLWASARARDVAGLQRVMQGWRERGGEPDVVSHNALMMALVRADRLPEARALLGRMRAEGLAPQVQTYGSLMDGYACRGQVRETVELFEEMLGEGHRANIVTLATLAKALAKGGRWEQVEECVAVMRALGMEVNRTVESIAIAAYSRAGRWERALELLEGFRARRPGGGVPTVMTYNSAMEGLAKAARWGEALQLLEHMASDGVIPHITSYNAAIAACVEAGRHEEAARVYGAMLAAGRSYPDACTCRRMLVVYGVLGRHAEALELAHTVLERPPEERRGSELVHGGAFAPYFLLCAQQGRADEARAMLDLLAKTDYPLDHASASAAAMALAKGGRPEEALQLSRGAGAGSGAGAEDLEVARVAAIMRALGRAGHWASALYLLDELRVKGQAAEVEGPLAVLVALEALAKAPGALPLLGPRLASQAEQDGNALGRVTSENPGALRLDLHTLLPLPAAQAAVLHAMGRAAGRGGCSLEVVLEGTEAEKVPALMEGIRAFCTSEGIKYSDANPRHLVIREADIEKWARRRDLLVA